jgi:hypothetical protein
MEIKTYYRERLGNQASFTLGIYRGGGGGGGGGGYINSKLYRHHKLF